MLPENSEVLRPKLIFLTPPLQRPGTRELLAHPKESKPGPTTPPWLPLNYLELQLGRGRAPPIQQHPSRNGPTSVLRYCLEKAPAKHEANSTEGDRNAKPDANPPETDGNAVPLGDPGFSFLDLDNSDFNWDSALDYNLFESLLDDSGPADFLTAHAELQPGNNEDQEAVDKMKNPSETENINIDNSTNHSSNDDTRMDSQIESLLLDDYQFTDEFGNVSFVDDTNTEVVPLTNEDFNLSFDGDDSLDILDFDFFNDMEFV